MENAKKTMEEVLEFINIHRESGKIILKEKQKRAVKELILGNDALVILSMGIDRSMIYMIFALESQDLCPCYLPLTCTCLKAFSY